ncbi:MAG: hypothetical protein NUV82_03565 [Candidatus Komeilibacteria bacterium]|nr:hypothetical protein [Candidatus Komeilibacteria bacterium]
MKDKIFAIEAVAIIVGTTVGAGILALPYVIAQAGFLTGLVVIVVVAAVMLLINLMLGEISLSSRGINQLPGYVASYLGRRAMWTTLILQVLALYGSLLAYVIGEGYVLTDLFGGRPYVNSLLFLGISGGLLYFGLNIVKRLELLLTLVIFAIVAAVYIITRAHIQTINLNVFSWTSLLVPYGAIIFASMGFSSIPQVREVLLGRERLMRRCLIIGTALPILLYIIFALIVVGVSGLATTEVATIGLGHMVGPSMIIFGNVFAFITMATSFLTLGMALLKTYQQDLKIHHTMAWILTLVVPLILFVLGVQSFSMIVSLIGAVAGGALCLIIILTFVRVKQRLRSPEYRITKNWWIIVPGVAVLLIGLIHAIITL